MLKIRLSRTGKTGQAQYRIIVTERRSKRDGIYVDSLGHYSPYRQPKVLELDTKKYELWIGKGAQPSDTVRGLYKQVTKTK